MLGKEKRLNRQSFASLNSQGFVFFTDNFSIRIIKNTEKPRFSCVVSNKVATTKPIRNKLKRQVYSVIGTIDTSKLKGSAIIYCKKGVLKLSFSEIKEELLKVLLK